MKHILCIVIITYAFLSPLVAEEVKPLSRIWEVEKVLVNGTEDGGEAGAYWIFRNDGTFRIVKRGRKSDGKWLSEKGTSVLKLKIGDQVILDGKFELADESLSITTNQGGDKLEFRFKDSKLEEEPAEPRNTNR